MDIHNHDEPIVEDEILTGLIMKLDEMEDVWINTPHGKIFVRTNAKGVPQITMFMPEGIKVTRRIEKQDEGQIINMDGKKV